MRIQDFTLEVEIFKSITDGFFCYLFEFSSEKGIPHRSVTVALLTWRGFGFYYPTFGSQRCHPMILVDWLFPTFPCLLSGLGFQFVT